MTGFALNVLIKAIDVDMDNTAGDKDDSVESSDKKDDNNNDNDIQMDNGNDTNTNNNSNNT